MGAVRYGYIAQGWLLGSQDFSGTDTFILAGYVLILAWIIWPVVVARPAKESFRAPAP
jgi:hypothetical protein